MFNTILQSLHELNTQDNCKVIVRRPSWRFHSITPSSYSQPQPLFYHSPLARGLIGPSLMDTIRFWSAGCGHSLFCQFGWRRRYFSRWRNLLQWMLRVLPNVDRQVGVQRLQLLGQQFVGEGVETIGAPVYSGPLQQVKPAWVLLVAPVALVLDHFVVAHRHWGTNDLHPRQTHPRQTRRGTGGREERKGVKKRRTKEAEGKNGLQMRMKLRRTKERGWVT